MERERAVELLDRVTDSLRASSSNGEEVKRVWGEGVVGAVNVRAGLLDTYFFHPSGITVNGHVNAVGEDEGIFSPERFIGFLASLKDKEVDGTNVLAEDPGVAAIMDLLDQDADYIPYP